MTKDTQEALEAIKPLAEILRIDVSADDKRLYCNGQAIGIACNSAWATCMEFIGYAFLKVYCKDRCVKVTRTAEERIKDYWISKALMKQIREREKEE